MNPQHFVRLLAEQGKGIDVIQLAGGDGRIMVLAARRRLVHGGIYDVVTGIDLHQHCQRQTVLEYVMSGNPKVALLGLRPNASCAWSSSNLTPTLVA